jgi:hypothetical protein
MNCFPRAGVLASVAIAIVAARGVAMGAAINADAGLWQTTSTSQQNGAMMAPRTSTSCITQAQIDNPQAIFSEQQEGKNQQCASTDFQQSSDTISWKYQCTGLFTLQTIGTVKFDSRTHYTGHIETHVTMQNRDTSSVMQVEGKRVGDCTPIQ